MFWESAVQENTEIMMDASFHMQCNSPSAGLGKLGTLNISSSRSSTLEDYATEHMSFYGDDDGEQTSQQTHNAHHNDDNTLWHSNEQFLLPDEGPAQRFHIIQKPKVGFQRRKSTVVVVDDDDNAHDHVQRPQDATTTNSNSTRNEKTPSRGFRVFNSLSSSCSMESSMEDDEYMDLFEMESLEEQLQKEQQYQPQKNKITLGLPSNLNSLISGQIKSSLTPRTPEMRRPSVRRCLSLNDNASPEDFRTQQKSNSSNNNTTACTTPYSSRLTPLLDNNQDVSPFSAFCFKRPDPPSVSNSPIQTKRYRGDEKENLICATSTFANTNTIITTIKSNALSTDVHTNKTTTSNSISTSSRVVLRKSMSMNDAEIMTALARGDNKGEPDLIGDFSKPFVLPLIEGRHRDLKNISSDTVAQLINGAFDDQVANYTIVDCRYPYEYEGGHIRGAKNLYTQEQIIDEFLTQKKTEQQQQQEAAILAAGTTKRNIIIFHCEFSSERGPRMSRFLRNNDRARNTNSYPTLDYPEIYLLHNGYKEFYETHAELCVPNAYRPMLEPAFGDAYRHFRAKSKSWNGDGLGGATSRLKKSRSRLML